MYRQILIVFAYNLAGLNSVEGTKWVTLAFDGWTNPHHTQTLGVAAVTVNDRTFLMKFKETER